MVSEYRAQQWEDRAKGYPDYITNTDLNSIVGAHNIAVPIKKDILVIGVGWGQAVKELVNIGNVVYVTDVSKTLIDIAKDYGAKDGVLSNDISKLPPVDLALCHLVLQHNIEEEIFRLINDVNLKETGIGSYQYSTLENDCVLTKQMIKDFNNGEQFFYSVERMDKIIAKTNKKKIASVAPVKYRTIYSFDWNFLRFSNK